MSKRLQVVFDEAEYAAVQGAAEREGLTVSAWVRRALRDARAAAAGQVREPGPGYGSEGEGGRPLHIPDFPAALHRRLRERARREHRSVPGEASYLLERALVDAEALSLLELEGLGAGLWQGGDAAEHVAGERDAWD